jgi:hypothetical protein
LFAVVVTAPEYSTVDGVATLSTTILIVSETGV